MDLLQTKKMKPRRSYLEYGKILFISLVFTLAQVISWFSSYSQFVWPFCKEYSYIIAVLLQIPATILFVYGIKEGYEIFGNAWSIRFLVFCLSYIVMPFLFWLFMGEKIFTIKNILSAHLSFLIVWIQIKL